MENNLVEKYFRALGWYPVGGDYCEPVEGQTVPNCWEYLPNITQHYPDFKKWVLEKMQADGYALFVVTSKHRLVATWGHPADIEYIEEEIKDNEILEAAVIAATRYYEDKKKKQV